MSAFPSPGPRRRRAEAIIERELAGESVGLMSDGAFLEMRPDVPDDRHGDHPEGDGYLYEGCPGCDADREAITRHQAQRPADSFVPQRVRRGAARGRLPVSSDTIVPVNEEAAPTLPSLADEPRKYRSHANAKSVTTDPDRRFDKTALHFDQHGRLMSHADYIAHCEKYDFVWRGIKSGERILDVGCGTDAALMRAINFVQSQADKVLDRNGGCYVGVDLNKLKPTNIAWAQLLGEVDMTSEEGYATALYAIPRNVAPEAAPYCGDCDGTGWVEGGEALKTGCATCGGSGREAVELRGYSLIVCLEVIEHMGVEDGRKMLVNMRDLMSPDGRIVLSTPVYDGKGQARNHIHEYYIPELQELIESVGLRVDKRMGTFTAEPQLKRWMKENRPDWYALYMEAREFHSSGYMSGVIAPMVPDIARNNVWVITAGG